MEEHFYEVPGDWAKRAWADAAKYEAMYKQSVDDPEGFWAEQAGRLDWFTAPTKIRDVTYGNKDVTIKWYEDGVLNVSHNCLDRHLATRGDQVAIIWEGDEPGDDKKLTYKQLHAEVCKFANGLKSLGVKKGDRVTIYMSMVPEIAVAMLACTRIGAVHSVVFGGFSPDSLSGRIHDCDSNLIITMDEGVRGGRKIPLKANTDAALENAPTIKNCVVIKRTGGDIGWVGGRDVWYHDLMEGAVGRLSEPEKMNAEDPLFILYTSGSTGKPKGVLHTTGGYLVLRRDDASICVRLSRRRYLLVHRGRRLGHRPQLYRLWTAGQWRDDPDVRRGLPNYPDASAAIWQVCDKHQVNIFYTAPTAIRALMREGDDPVTKTSRKSMRLLGTVGEPINPEAWRVVLRMWSASSVARSSIPGGRPKPAASDHAAARRHRP